MRKKLRDALWAAGDRVCARAGAGSDAGVTNRALFELGHQISELGWKLREPILPPMTFTLSISGPAQWRPGKHTNRWGKRLRSARVWWLWFAVAWYRFDDRELVTRPHDWGDRS